jgi:hypothetical protein
MYANKVIKRIQGYTVKLKVEVGYEESERKLVQDVL